MEVFQAVESNEKDPKASGVGGDDDKGVPNLCLEDGGEDSDEGGRWFVADVKGLDYGCFCDEEEREGKGQDKD